MIQRIRPVNDRLIVERDAPDTLSSEGLHIPQQAIEPKLTGVVLSCGPSVSQCKVGDRILFSQFGGIDIKVDGFTSLMISDGDVLAVILPKE